METTRSNSSSKSSNASKDPGIYTCPTCNALFTCLKFYQQHVSQHADANGTKLFCCNRCRYSTDSCFQYNWHQMSHKDTEAHSCSVCQDKSVIDNYNSSNHLNGSDPVATNKNSRKSQQNGNSNKKVKYSNSKVKQEVQPYVKQEESDEEDEDEESEEGESDTEESQDNEDEEDNENEDDDDESDEESEDDEEEEIDEEVDQSQIQSNANFVRTPAMVNNNQQEIDEEVSDEDDDEESEIESEEDNGENNELPDEFLVSQRLNSGSAYQYDGIQNAINNSSSVATNNLIDQGAALSKQTNNVGEIPELMADNDGIICNKGKGKGNRKSRTINQMGGQVDDEMSQLRRKFHCSHCGKSFKTKSHLQRHILTHTGEKPYHCNRCGAKFNQSSSLRNHIIALHTKEYPHFCNHCNKGFLMPALLQKHLQTSHRDQDA